MLEPDPVGVQRNLSLAVILNRRTKRLLTSIQNVAQHGVPACRALNANLVHATGLELNLKFAEFVADQNHLIAKRGQTSIRMRFINDFALRLVRDFPQKVMPMPRRRINTPGDSSHVSLMYTPIFELFRQTLRRLPSLGENHDS